MIDGTYFQDFCLVSYFDADLKHLQYCEIIDKENYRDFKLSLMVLVAAGLNIRSITSDGEKGLILAVREVLPDTLHQRCIIHVQRMSLIYLGRFPQSEAGRDLRKITRLLHNIYDHADKKNWIKKFRDWEIKYHDFLDEKNSIWSDSKLYRHYDIRRVRTLINNSLPNIFYYLDDNRIPKSTNGLESRFSYLKNNLRTHRGLSKENRKSFILWYCWFKYNS
jgi:transposase-like protein